MPGSKSPRTRETHSNSVVGNSKRTRFRIKPTAFPLLLFLRPPPEFPNFKSSSTVGVKFTRKHASRFIGRSGDSFLRPFRVKFSSLFFFRARRFARSSIRSLAPFSRKITRSYDAEFYNVDHRKLSRELDTGLEDLVSFERTSTVHDSFVASPVVLGINWNRAR